MIVSKLEYILRKRRIRISDVVRDTGLTRPSLAKLVNNKSGGITFDTLNKLCKLLSVTVSDILEFYDIDIKELTLTLNEANLSYHGTDTDGYKTLIDDAELNGKISFEQPQYKDLVFRVFLTPELRKHNKNESIYSVTLHFYELTRKEYLDNLPDEIESLIIDNLLERIFEKFSQYDSNAELGSVTYFYKDELPL